MWTFFQDLSAIVLGLLALLGIYIYATVEAIRLWAYANSDVVYGIGVVAVLAGTMTLLLRYLWRRLRERIKPLYWMFLQRPAHRVLAPVRRLHRRWSERNMEKRMAKWKASALADIVGDALLEANILGVISDQEYRKYMEKVGKTLDLPDLIRIRNNKLAIAHRLRKHGKQMGLLDENDKLVKQPPVVIPGGKPGENHIPQWEGLGDKFLRKLKKA